MCVLSNTEHWAIIPYTEKKKNIKNIYLFQFIGNYIICRNGHSLLQPTGLAQLGDAAITVPESSQLWSAERTM